MMCYYLNVQFQGQRVNISTVLRNCHQKSVDLCESTGHSTARSSLDGRAVALKRTACSEHGMGMASVNQTRPHCVNQMGNTHTKPLAARPGRGTAWVRHVMCE